MKYAITYLFTALVVGVFIAVLKVAADAGWPYALAWFLAVTVALTAVQTRQDQAA
jgi:hypothetical protein